MAWPSKKTHRCAGSLESRVSIRKDAKKDKYGKETIPGWTLWTREHDLEYDFYSEVRVGVIAYCPFCGAKMDEEGDADD